jgi:hypothetical protein
MATSALFVALTLVTIIWPTWIEGLSGLEPDGGNGDGERWVAVVFALLALAATLLARREYRDASIRLASESPRGR